MSFEGPRADSASLSWKRLLGGFVMIYLLALLVLVPARLVFDWLEGRLSLTLPEPRGTLWQGRIDNAEPLGGLRNLAWDFAPAALLQGRLGYRVSAGEGALTGRVGVAPGGQLAVQALRLDGRLSDLSVSLNGIPLLVDVRLNGLVESFTWGEEGCVELEGGRLLVDDWSGMLADRLNPLGGAMLALSCNDGRLTGEVTAGSERAGLAGHLSLGPDGGYTLDLTARPTDPALRELYLDLGFQPRGQGLVFQRRGRVPL